MATWIRTEPRTYLDAMTVLWHRPGESASAATRGLTFGACGSNLGAAIEARANMPDAGDRCPTCQGMLAASAARSDARRAEVAPSVE